MGNHPVWIPNEESIKKTNLYLWMNKLGYSDYDSFYKDSTTNIEWFWHEAEKEMNIEWYQPYSKVLDVTRGVQWPTWYIEGKLNVTNNAIDKWLHNDHSAKKEAIIWEGEDGVVQKITYKQLGKQVNSFAAGLKQLGVKKGDCITLYLPMLIETVIAMLAISKIGAIFTPAFSGYAANAVAKRIAGCDAKIIITADGFLRRGKVIQMKEEADKAIKQAESIEKMIVVNRIGREIPWDKEVDLRWEDVIDNDQHIDNEEMDSSDPFMLIYSSGTTGQPKGIIHTHSGFPLKAAFDARFGMDLNAHERMMWVTDMGWMMGPFLVFGTLLNNSTMVLYEGSTDYPEVNRLWKLVEKHQVTHLGISPTLIRVLMKQGEQWLNNIKLTSLKVFGSTGEPWNVEPWLWLFHKVGKSKIPIMNYSGGTEISGGILGNILLKPIAPVSFNAPLPGMAADVYNLKGETVRSEVGELVLTKPWVGMANGFWKEPDRYIESYWNRWENIWVHGDWVSVDENHFWTITGRSDDTLNIAGKRVGPAEVESILVEHPQVVEAATIGVPNNIKGEVAVCFVVLKDKVKNKEKLISELYLLVERNLGKSLKPHDIYTVSELPKTRNAKVMRRVIKSIYLGQDPGDLSALENQSAISSISNVSS
ncbi:AMP-binding protein [Cytobacillus sp. IB215665]|uniref:AMP-binding protein n=1 Tax=Cytobacillus sp. IB215665 TaxID=3097357 RepID=UPI002A13DCB3|nr:AMP-binding protein [Cytobacillus sp. IB215665]MDX8364769.1 AMP-binding protein [Cytobacillus sp. IB215665]